MFAKPREALIGERGHDALHRILIIAGITAGAKVEWRARSEQNQPIRLSDRQFLEQHRVHHAEERRVRADAERQRKHGDGRNPLLLQQHSRPIAQVLPETLHSSLRKSAWSHTTADITPGFNPNYVPARLNV